MHSLYQDILHNLKREIKIFNSLPPLLYFIAFRFHYFSSQVFIIIIIYHYSNSFSTFFFNLSFWLFYIFFFSFKLHSCHATMARVVGPVLYFWWLVKGPRSDRLIPSSIWAEFGLVIERCLCNTTPVVRDLCLALSCVVGT